MKWFNTNHLSDYFKSSEGWLYILIGFVWGYILLGLANAFFLRIPGLNIIGPYARALLYVIAALFAFRAIRSHIRQNDILFYFLFLAFYLAQFVIHPENQSELSENFFDVFVFAFPLYFIGCTIDINKLYRYLLIISIGCIVFMAFHGFFFNNYMGRTQEAGHYYMGPAYDLLPCVLFVCWDWLKKRSIFSFSFFLLGLVLLFSYGTRGPIVCVAFFIISNLFFSEGKKIWWLIIIVVILSIIVYFYFDWIMIFLDSLFSQNGGSTRITNKAFNDALDDDSGRGFIIGRLKSLLDGGEKLSYGIFGSYKYVNGYAHRIYWDFWFSYGYVFGSIIMLLLLIIFIRGLRNSKTSEEKGFWFLLLSNSIIALMFSETYIVYGPFYLFLGYCISRIRNVQLKTIS